MDHKNWRNVRREFRGDHRLSAEVIYALPKRLLEELQRFAPGLLSPQDLQFERRLRELGATGFWRHRPFLSEVIDGHFFSELFSLDGSGSEEAEFLAESVSNWKERLDQIQTKSFRNIVACCVGRCDEWRLFSCKRFSQIRIGNS